MTAILELDGRVARQESYRFDLYDQSNTLKDRDIDIESDMPGEITNDVNRNIRRTLTGLSISPNVLDDIDTLTERLKVIATIEGTDYSCGLFLFGDHRTKPFTFGTESSSSLVDQCVILDQPISTSIGYTTGQVITDALAAIAESVGIVSTSIEPSSATVQAPIAWPIGQKTYLTVMSDLCAMVGYLDPYFNNDGTLVCRPAPSLDSATADFTYGRGTATTGRVVDGTVEQRNDLLTAPNRYLVVSTDATAGPTSGFFDVPASAPFSAANRGRVVTKVITSQGIADTAAAQAAAEAAYTQDSSTYSWCAFDASPDPRHDTFDIVSFDDDLYREQSWKLRLAPGGPHHHDLRRVYQ